MAVTRAEFGAQVSVSAYERRMGWQVCTGTQGEEQGSGPVGIGLDGSRL